MSKIKNALIRWWRKPEPEDDGRPYVTWDDVDILRRASDSIYCYRDPDLEDEFLDSEGSILTRLADRIAALLPPREEES